MNAQFKVYTSLDIYCDGKLTIYLKKSILISVETNLPHVEIWKISNDFMS